ncbi:probable protein phosphatase 2C 39 [Aristolochia californica]|uniref:probable protein phosphatase 2C 39 n=1 Tax=Aristolochia californica TaxID=171875 RepID=UPI0035DB7C23
MEDYVVAQIRSAHGNRLGLYAIFDGHSGQHVADWLQSHLFDNILDEPDFWTKPESAIKRDYKETDNEILDEVVGARRGGSSAVTAILINGEKLIVANMGESRAIICSNGAAKQLSVDHEPEKERDMVESKGGLVSQKPGNVSRVDGQLAMTRAFGDQSLKQQITSKPDVTTEMIDQETEFIILGSDGLWKVMSNQEAADSMRGI